MIGGRSSTLLPNLKKTLILSKQTYAPRSPSELEVISPNGRISRIIGKQPPKPDGTDPNSLRYNKLTALYQKPEPVKTVFCEICGSEFREATLPVHIRNCFKRY